MSERQEPHLFAWVDRANVADAYLATLSTLFEPHVFDHEVVRKGRYVFLTPGDSPTLRPLEEVLAQKREALRGRGAFTTVPVFLPSQRSLMEIGLEYILVKGHYRGPGCLLTIGEQSEIMPAYACLVNALGNLSLLEKAAILGLYGQERMEMIFLALCAPDGHSRVRTGAYNTIDKLMERYQWGNGGWRAPLEMAGTYNGDHFVARDVAISWLYLHDGALVDSLFDLSPEAFTARVEAAPAGATVGIASKARHITKHLHYDEHREIRALDPYALISCRGTRKRFHKDQDLTREQVLATLQTPNETLLQALEAVATPDREWLKAEKRALEVLALNALALQDKHEPTMWIDIDDLEERNFLEAHAPFHVRRLQNGGVMLATHPYRYLWPLWAKALDLLGIRPLTP